MPCLIPIGPAAKGSARRRYLDRPAAELRSRCSHNRRASGSGVLPETEDQDQMHAHARTLSVDECAAAEKAFAMLFQAPDPPSARRSLLSPTVNRRCDSYASARVFWIRLRERRSWSAIT